MPTPSLLLDRRVVARNTAAMTERMKRHGVRLRPHLKTSKSAKVAGLATAGNFGGITVSTMREAAYFADHGFDDITYAVSIVPDRLPEVAALTRRGVRLNLLTDDAGVAGHLAGFARQEAIDLHVLLEVDCGLGRSGVAVDGEELVEIAGALHAAEGITFEGVLTHAGHSYHCKTVQEVRRVADEERETIVAAAARLREAGLVCPTVSAGSTPTAIHAATLAGVTEMRPGNYVFFDLFQVGAGSCRREEVAVTVVTSVIGHNRRAGRILLDAGSLALSSDTSANEQTPGVGYGVVLDAAGRGLRDDLRVARVNQEHGMLEGTEPPPFDELPIGTRLRVLPNHACITTAMFDRYHVTTDGRTVTEEWDRTNRW